MILNLHTTHLHAALAALALVVTACPAEVANTGEGSTTGTSGGTSTDPSGSSTEIDTPTTTPEPTTTASTSGTSGPGETTSEPGTTTLEDETTGGVVPVPEVCEAPPVPVCDVPITKCKMDRDHDLVEFTCDNDVDHTNPDQADFDGDGFGDTLDLCPTIVTDSNAADTDRDGVGNACDVCARPPSFYNQQNDGVPFYMRVRNIPLQEDSDRDGVGDACDNCVRAPNCLEYGEGPGLTPFVVGQPIDVEAPNCQSDFDFNLVGDSCAGAMAEGAAGPVGFAATDDFDQDGLANLGDGCPRQPVLRRKCDGDEDCPDGATCTPTGVCGHADHDGDGVGDICDTCPEAPNPEQVTEAGAKADDLDGDFIGAACERNTGCLERANPRRFGFYDISVGGRCCVTVYEGAALQDPDGEPLVVDELGPREPGVFELPAGCEEALKNSADGKSHRLESCNVDDPGQLYDYLCLLPVWDQDYDDIPDECDLCEFEYDPSNAIYIDENNKEWPQYGKYCNGAYSLENYDPADMCQPKP